MLETTTENYLRTKRTLAKVMKKLTVQELQEICQHRHQTYIFFDCAVDALMGKLSNREFQEFAQRLYKDRGLS